MLVWELLGSWTGFIFLVHISCVRICATAEPQIRIAGDPVHCLRICLMCKFKTIIMYSKKKILSTIIHLFPQYPVTNSGHGLIKNPSQFNVSN